MGNLTDYIHYVIILLLIVVGFLAVKKAASCLFKTVISIAVLAGIALAWWYFS
ncbi:MAG: sulfate transporter [Prevotella sp.]|nr:sulfate transporter [Prevotella sp.]